MSLTEQRAAIEQFASRNGLRILRWFEEQETAAKRGRPVFSDVMTALRTRRADGLLIHKIDRSARNLKDWSELGELIDQGIDVRFVNEGLDLTSRGGRLSADIQAVVAADYVRNLREETIKGFYGRLKQGFFPMPAPIGYADRGAGHVKEIDPDVGPLVRHAFELYASAKFSQSTLADKMFQLGLRTKSGKRLSAKAWSRILNNQFYIGTICIKKTGAVFAGSHEPLVPIDIFDHVQRIMEGKYNSAAPKHGFIFRRLFKCDACRYTLIPEGHKGHVYYRCQTRNCPMTSVREEVLAEAIRNCLQSLQLSNEEYAYFSKKIAELRDKWSQEHVARGLGLKSALQELESREQRLIDAYVDGHLDADSFTKRKTALQMERRSLNTQIDDIENGKRNIPDQIKEFLELANRAYSLYESAFEPEKREMILRLTSNRVVREKTPIITLDSAFEVLASRPRSENGGPYRRIHRTWDALLQTLLNIGRAESSASAG